jgi:predicted ATP-grasp superfamily ATP-dependent carboligase
LAAMPRESTLRVPDPEAAATAVTAIVDVSDK